MIRLAAATAHPLATTIALEIGAIGGNAVDAAIAAQAAVAVLLPNAAGLGGDGLSLVDDGSVQTAINGTGLSAAGAGHAIATLGDHVTVPGLVSSWFELHRRYGSLPMPRLLEPAVELCRTGISVDDELMRAIDAHRERIRNVSPRDPLLELKAEDRWHQGSLADLLMTIGSEGPSAFYGGAAVSAMTAAASDHGGALSSADFSSHRTQVSKPIVVAWNGGTVSVQPPMSQGVLLAAALQWLETHDDWLTPSQVDHLLVELTGAIFEWRDDCGLGTELLHRVVDVDLNRVTHRRGARPYLHTAGVAIADDAGLIVSSLISVFDSFGSAIWVPKVGLRLNDRALGFTHGRNAPRAAFRPVHTLAPAIVRQSDGTRIAIATPGADGQVQTLLQVLCAARTGSDLPEAIARLRWRSEGGCVVIPPQHSAVASLAERGHALRFVDAGSDMYGAVVAAGVGHRGVFAVADWRRQTNAATTPA